MQQLLRQPQVMRHNAFIIQKYIERPLLINKRKFDIRVWVLLSHEHDVFFFRYSPFHYYIGRGICGRRAASTKWTGRH